MLTQRSVSITLSQQNLPNEQYKIEVKKENDHPNSQDKKQHTIQRHNIYITNPRSNYLKQLVQDIKKSSSKQYSSNKESLLIQTQTSNFPSRKTNQSNTRVKTFTDILQRKRLQVFVQEKGQKNYKKKQTNIILPSLLNSKAVKQKINIEVNCPIHQNKTVTQIRSQKRDIFEFLVNFLNQHAEHQKSIIVNFPKNQRSESNDQSDIIKQLQKLPSQFPGLKITLNKNSANPEQAKGNCSKFAPNNNGFKRRMKASQEIMNQPKQVVQKSEQSYKSSAQTVAEEQNLQSNQKPIFKYLPKKVLDSENTFKQISITSVQQINIENSTDPQLKKANQQAERPQAFYTMNRRKTILSTQKMTLGLRRGSYTQEEIKKITQRLMQPKKFVILINRVDIEEENAEQKDKNKH